MTEEKKPRKSRGVTLSVPDGIVKEMKTFSEAAGVSMPKIKAVVSEAAFQNVAGNIAALYKAKVFGAEAEVPVQEEAHVPVDRAGRPMGS